MDTLCEQEINPEFIQSVLALPTMAEQAAFLSGVNLLNEAGLSNLMDYAAGLVGRDPGQARKLAQLCADKVPKIVARALYIQAQTYAINGEFDVARAMIEASREHYLTLGQTGDALRTNVGLMNVLCESGQYQDALDIGQAILDAVEGTDEPDSTLPPSEATMLAALAYQNLGVCHRRVGHYEEAIYAYAMAEARYRKLDMPVPIGHLSINRGLVLINLGQAREALTALEAAAAIFAEAGSTRTQAQAVNNIAIAHQLLGNYDRSLDAFEQTRRLYSGLDAQAEQNILLLDTAHAYLVLNLYPEALVAYQEAEAKLRSAGMTYHLARAKWGMGATFIAQSRYHAADDALAQAATLFIEAQNTPRLSGVMLEQAALLAARGERGLALKKARQALDLIAGHDWPVQHIYAYLRIADLLLPDFETAESLLREAQETAHTLILPHLRYRINQRLGHLRLLQGRDEEAKALLEMAIADIEQLRGTLAREAIRASFLRDKIAAYQDLVLLYLNRGDQASLQHAFAVAEQAKSRSLVDLLVGLVETKLDTQLEPELAARLQTLQADLNAIYNEAYDNGASGERYTRQTDLNAQAILLENEISRLRLQAVAPTAVADSLAQSVPSPSVPAPSSANVTLLAYHIVGDEIVAFVHENGHLHVLRHTGSATTARQLLQQLAMQWSRFRAGRAFVSRHMKQLELSTRRVLSKLYTELVAPLETILIQLSEKSPLRRLVIIPHGLLHQVPFHALFDGRQYLLERFEISYAPSVAVFNLCQERAPRQTGRALVLGVADPSIPFVAQEARTLARHFPNAKTYVNEQATLDVLQTQAPASDVLHLACHGLFRQDNPMFSALKLHDGWLTAADAMQLDLNGALVTLSACESGRNQVFTGDEIIGLTRAFLGAGAATLVASLWLVEDETTAVLMAHWYEQMRRQQGRAAALRVAMLALKSEYPHPYYWAPFVLIGQP